MAEWLTLQEAAQESGYSDTWLSKMISRGAIPAESVKRDGRRLYIRADVAAQLKIRPHVSYQEDEQPADAIELADPKGEYLGLILEPAAAMRYVKIRANRLRYGGTHERCTSLRSLDVG